MWPLTLFKPDGAVSGKTALGTVGQISDERTALTLLYYVAQRQWVWIVNAPEDTAVGSKEIPHHRIDLVASMPTTTGPSGAAYNARSAFPRGKCFGGDPAGVRVHHGYGLLSCVQITAYNFHRGLLRPEPFLVRYCEVYSVRFGADSRYDISLP